MRTANKYCVISTSRALRFNFFTILSPRPKSEYYVAIITFLYGFIKEFARIGRYSHAHVLHVSILTTYTSLQNPRSRYKFGRL